MTSVIITRSILVSEAVEMTTWLMTLPKLVIGGAEPYKFKGPTWAWREPIEFYRDEDATAFRLKFAV